MGNPNIVRKQGRQLSADDPFTFIMSTDSRDRHGDIVRQNWRLASFRRNPIALFGHNHAIPIGTWANVRVVQGQLVGMLRLAKAGTSELIDTIRSLVEQGILSAVSVGFRPHETEAIDEKKPWAGNYLNKNELMECSLVTVGANRDALIQAAKSMNLGEDTLASLKALELESRPVVTPNPSTLSRDSDSTSVPKSITPRSPTTMTLSERIKALQDDIAATRAEVDDLEVRMTNAEGSEADELLTQVSALNEDVAKNITQLEKLESWEASKAQRVQQMSDQHKSAASDDPTHTRPATGGAPAAAREKGHRALATFSSILRGHVMQRNPLDCAKEFYKDEPDVFALVKAASAPARVDTAGWAQELVRETWSEFMLLMRDMAVYPRLPGARLNFDGYGTITVPSQAGRGTLSGGFVAEGAPIPVVEGAVTSTSLTPKGLKVISSFTRELAMRSNPSIEGMIRNQMLEDTAEALDTHYLSTTARTTVVPGGVQDAVEFGAGNINATTGATAAAIQADTKAMIGRLITSRFSSAVWVMNPIRVLGLMDIQDAASGVFLYKDELASGMFRGFPYISSGNVTAATVVLQASNAVTFASEYGPAVDASNSASLHFEDTTPLDIGVVAGPPNTVAAPVKSLFQTDSVALRMTMGLDHRLVRANGVQVLTGAAW